MSSKTIIQLSDLHFSIHNEKSIQALNKTLNHLKSQVADLVIITGDITDLNDISSYQAFLKAYQDTNDTPIILTAGNHDNSQVMNSLFDAELLSSQVILGNWLLLILDSSVEGKDHGFITHEELVYLKSQMTKFPEHHALIFLHHHLLPVNSAWLDQYILENTEALFQAITPYKERIHGIFHGHIHQPSFHTFNDIDIYGTPSTSSQYKPDSEKPILISNDSYYREIKIHENGTTQTEIILIP